MSMLRNVLTYMGLGPDEDYEDGYPYEVESRVDERDDELGAVGDLTINVRDEPDPHAQRPRPDWLVQPTEAASTTEARRRKISIDDDDPERDDPPSTPGRHDMDRRPSAVRSLRAVPRASTSESERVGDGITVRPAVTADESSPRPASSRKPARHAKPRALSPQSFGDAKTLADEFKDDVPVIMNLQGIERDLARRLIDFASGICYALDGGMEKIASQVFLLTPQSVELSDEDRRRIEERGYDGS